MAVAELAVNLVANTGNFVKNMNKVSRQVDMTGRQLQGAGKAIVGLTAPLIAIGGVSLKMSKDFNKSMAAVEVMISRVQTEGGKNIDQLKKSVIELSNQTGISSKEMSEGLFLVISTFGNTADATKQLEVAAKAALAGGATVSETISLLGVVSKNFGDTSAEAQQKIIDLAFVTNELGVTNFQELASSMTAVTPIAATMGVQIEELFASYSALTGVTGNTSEVTTQMAAALGALQKPTGDMIKIFKALGVTTGDELIRQHGLLGAFQLVKQEQEKLGVTMATVMGRKEGLNFVTGLLTSQTEKYTQALDANNNSAGTGEKAYETYTEGINKAGLTMDKLLNVTKNMTTQLGDELAPVLLDFVENGLVPVLSSLQGLLKWFQELSPTTKKWIVQITAGTAALGGILFVAGKFLSALAALWKLKVIFIPVVKTLAVVIGALLTPIGLVVTAVAGLTAGIYYFWDEIKVAIEWLKKFSIELGGKLKDAADVAITAVKKMMTGIWDTISSGFRKIINFVGDATGKVTGFFNDMYIKVVGNSIVPDMVDEVIDEFGRMGSAMITGTDGAVTGVISQFNQLSPAINKVFNEVLGSSSEFINEIARMFNPQGLGGIFGDFFGSMLPANTFNLGSIMGAFTGARPDSMAGPLMESGKFAAGGIIAGFTAAAPAIGAILAPIVAQGTITGLQAAFSGKSLSSLEKGALALPTFGLSFVFDDIKSIFGKGTTNIATLARREFERQFNEMIDGKNIRIFDENGVLREVDKISVGAKDRFNKPWAEAFHELTGDASSAFLGVGYALQNLMGISEDVGGQIAHILATEVGGSLQNLALIIMGLEIPIEDMETAMVEAFMNGSISAHDFSVFMQGIHQAYAEIEAAQHDLGLAIQLWLGSGGQGEQALRSFQAVASAAMSQGIRSVQDFVTQAVAQGLLTAEQGEQALRAFAAHGITSMDQIANASDATLIHILGTLETMEKEGENSFFGVAEKVNENFQNIENRWDRIRNLPNAVLNLEIKVGGDKIPQIVGENMQSVNKQRTPITVPALDSGGIVTSPTLALIGERRNEAVIPLQELPDMMKSVFDGAGGSSIDMGKTVFNIDARGAVRGVAEEIKRALQDFTDVKNGLLGTT
jgi:TP901 family phage tail tape measure protein